MAAEKLATEQGKEFALKALKARRRKSAKVKKIDNSSLYAGSPMYFYCKTCGAIADILPENYIAPPKKYCNQCQAMIDLNWME
jgi:uncharacterized OB-fold protein